MKHTDALRYILYVLLLLALFEAGGAQINLTTEISNNAPNAKTLQTYSRYTDVNDSFPTNNFTICLGETNRTIHLRIVAEDKNSNVELSNGGNITWKLVEILANGSEATVPTFGNAFKEATYETNISKTQLSYIGNTTLTNNGTKQLYKIITNITDTNNASTINTTTFTLHQSDFCIRTETNATLLTTQPYEIAINYCTFDIYVDENVTGKIIVTLHNESPVDTNVDTALDKYMTVDIEGVILQNTINLSLLVNYTQEEITTKGLNESSLRIYEWGSWNLQEGNVDSTTNRVTFEINETTLSNQSYRLGTYSVRGTLLSNGSTNNGGNTGGGGSGSGGGNIGENLLNILRPLRQALGIPNLGIPNKLDTEKPTKENEKQKEQTTKTTETTMYGLIQTITTKIQDPTFWKHTWICILLLLIAITEFILLIKEKKKNKKLQKKLAETNKENNTEETTTEAAKKTYFKEETINKKIQNEAKKFRYGNRT